jgi:hypothetical protein
VEHGRHAEDDVLGRELHGESAVAAAVTSRFSCVSDTPFGLPMVPDV